MADGNEYLDEFKKRAKVAVADEPAIAAAKPVPPAIPKLPPRVKPTPAAPKRRGMTVMQLTQETDGPFANVQFDDGTTQQVREGDDLPEGTVAGMKSTRGLFIQPAKGDGYWTHDTRVLGSGQQLPSQPPKIAGVATRRHAMYPFYDFAADAEQHSASETKEATDARVAALVKSIEGHRAAEVAKTSGVWSTLDIPEQTAASKQREEDARADLNIRSHNSFDAAFEAADTAYEESVTVGGKPRTKHTMTMPDGSTRTFIRDDDTGNLTETSGL